MSLSLLTALIAQVTHIGRPLDFDHVVSYVVAIILIGVFVLFFYNRLYVYKRQEANKERKSQNARLALVLKAGKLRIWVYEVAKRHYSYLTDEGTYGEDLNPIEFAQQFDRDQIEQLRQAVFDVCDMKNSTSKVTIHGRSDYNGEHRCYEMNISVARYDKFGFVSKVLGIQHDITDDVRKKEKVNQLLMRYHTVFNSSLLDMAYYDKDGVLSTLTKRPVKLLALLTRK